MIHGYTCIHALQYFTIRMTSTSHCITVRVRVHLKKTHRHVWCGGWTFLDSCGLLPSSKQVSDPPLFTLETLQSFSAQPFVSKAPPPQRAPCQRAGWCQYLRVIGAPVTHSLNIINAHQELMNTNLV